MIDNLTAVKRAFEQPNWYLSKTAYNIRIRVETIGQFLEGREMQTILDIGCGDGSLSAPLLSANNRITLLDRSKSMLDLAISRIPEESRGRVRVVNEDFMTARFEGHSFDLIICVGVMAYVDQAQPFLEKTASLLKPGGTLIMECTDGSHVFSHFSRAYLGFRRLLLGDAMFRTIKRPSSDLLTLFSKNGFEVCEVLRYTLPLPGMRKLISQRVSYRAIRLIFGKAKRSRLQWLGNECIYHLCARRTAGTR